MRKGEKMAQLSTKAYRLLRRFSVAVVEESWSGSQDPADRPGIHHEYQQAKKALYDYIRVLEAAERELEQVMDDSAYRAEPV